MGDKEAERKETASKTVTKVMQEGRKEGSRVVATRETQGSKKRAIWEQNQNKKGAKRQNETAGETGLPSELPNISTAVEDLKQSQESNEKLKKC